MCQIAMIQTRGSIISNWKNNKNRTNNNIVTRMQYYNGLWGSKARGFYPKTDYELKPPPFSLLCDLKKSAPHFPIASCVPF